MQGLINELPRIVYVDGNETSKKLAANILEKLGASVDFVVGNLLSESTWDEINAKLDNESKLFCSFETIEHLNNPEEFWGLIGKYKGSDMVLSLPIGPKIPSHNIFFINEDTVKNYVEQYLKIKDSKIF